MTRKSFLFLCVFSLFHFSLLAGDEKLSTDLIKILNATDNPVPVVIVMKSEPLHGRTMLWNQRTSDIQQYLVYQTSVSQQDIRQRINELIGQGPGVTGHVAVRRWKPFWLTNSIMATVTPETILEFSDRDDVQKIVLDRKILLRVRVDSIGPEDIDYTYGLQKIGVPELRSRHPELTGQGVKVGVLDTGIDASHPEFKGKNIVFKDFVNNQTEPYDDHGHGTHATGTICGMGSGGTQFGVAPGVDLVVGKVFTSGGGASLSALLRAMEWMADPDGKPETNDRPRVVNNSWGGSATENINDDPFFKAVTSWVDLNIFPSFAAGNEGPGKSTVGSPGGLPVSFAVGATDDGDSIARFSSRGPVNAIIDGKQTSYVKPDVSAPGVKIYSSMPGGGYGKMSGTSMATPHVTGAIALLYQVNPALTIAQMSELLMKSSDNLGNKEKNNTFGAGRIDLSKAVGLLTQDK